MGAWTLYVWKLGTWLLGAWTTWMKNAVSKTGSPSPKCHAQLTWDWKMGALTQNTWILYSDTGHSAAGCSDNLEKECRVKDLLSCHRSAIHNLLRTGRWALGHWRFDTEHLDTVHSDTVCSKPVQIRRAMTTTTGARKLGCIFSTTEVNPKSAIGATSLHWDPKSVKGASYPHRDLILFTVGSINRKNAIGATMVKASRQAHLYGCLFNAVRRDLQTKGSTER